MTASPIVIVYDRDDARRFLDSGLRAPNESGLRPGGVLALTASAEAALAGCGLPVAGTVQRLGDGGHARVAARMRRLDRALAPMLAAEDALDGVAGASLRHDLHYLGCFVLAVWVMLGPRGPWLVPDQRGGWQAIADRAAAQIAVVRHIGTRPGIYRDGPRRPPLAGLISRVNRWAAGFLAGRVDILLTASGYGMDNLADHAARRHPPLGCAEIRGARGMAGGLALPLLSLWRARRGGAMAVLVAVPAEPAWVRAAAGRMLAALPDPLVAGPLAAFADRVAAQAALTQGLETDTRRLLAKLRPRAVVAHALRWSNEAALAKAARERNIPVILLSHGSHPDPAAMGNLAAAYAHAANADDLLVSDLADVTVVQSPHAEAAARTLRPQARLLRTRPIQWGYKPLPPAPLRSDGPRRLLQAGTFKPLASLRPYIYETSAEFVAGLRSLMAAVAALPDVELVIRMRAGRECDLDDLRTLLPPVANVRIKSHREGAFLDDLMAAHALVSFSSTTIEEALHARRPVVLWGGSQRTRHLPARTTPPSPGDRAAIYAPATPGDLAPLLAAVLDAHADPLTDAELAGHVWPAALGIPQFLDRIAARDWVEGHDSHA